MVQTFRLHACFNTSCSLNSNGLRPVARYGHRISKQIVERLEWFVAASSPIDHGNLPANIADAILSP